MRCGAMTRFSRCALAIVLTLAAGPSAAFGESIACYVVQRGDTPSRVAKRVTGDASNEYQSWFAIVDLRGKSVPKSQYDRVRSGWRACVPEKMVEGRLLTAGQVVTSEAARHVEPASPPSANAPRTIRDVFRPSFVDRASLNVEPTQIWLGAAVVVPALGFLILGGYIRRRSAARI